MGNDTTPSPSPLWQMMRKLFRREPDPSLRETIEELIEESSELEPSIASDERELLGNVLNLRDLTAEDVMTPRADIIGIHVDTSADSLLQTLVKTGFSRLPVYRETLDEVIGIVDIKDVVAWCVHRGDFSIRQLMKDTPFISPTMQTLDLLFEMRESGHKMALVVDEYGGVDGLVTLSDLMEEIIGDIQHAHDTTPVPKIVDRTDRAIIADGRVTLDQLRDERDLELNLEDHQDEIETIGGLVVALAGRVPVRGELFTHPAGLDIEILDADPRRVKRVCIHLIPVQETRQNLG